MPVSAEQIFPSSGIKNRRDNILSGGVEGWLERVIVWEEKYLKTALYPDVIPGSLAGSENLKNLP